VKYTLLPSGLNAALRSSSGVETIPGPKITGDGIGFVEAYGCAADRWPSTLPQKRAVMIAQIAADFIGEPPRI
jgi:hypothetical protein